ncbi:phage portal protein [Geomicrobium sp. JCM 19039]|uniref:phage portal protein n=1 Tax=Geomicrobium sp. JCM 19039 TaxID=1460636 RepID=UPI00045F1BDF|nr:phage portal protein [Geomicrobium sp. JCM 19039]GAK12233.1 hypothetical protein JCM19039_1988 [Geomicrobium sp. JCM 19039]
MAKGFNQMNHKELKEYARGMDNQFQYLTEKIGTLELALEDQGWQKLTMESSQEFSQQGLMTIRNLSRVMFLKNPLIRRAVLTQSNYVFGKGVDFSVVDEEKHANEKQTMDDFKDNVENKRELTSHQSMTQKENELQLFGELFFVLVTLPTTKQVIVRSIPADEITDIIMDPEDSKRPLFYKRERDVQRMNFTTGQYETKHEVTYFRDWVVEGDRAANHKRIGEHDVRQDAVIYHVSVNHLSDMKRGVSEVYSALDWARAYKEFLENWATIVKAHSRYAWKVATKGGKKGVANAQQAMKQGPQGNGAPPLTASSFIGSEGTDIEPMRTAGATTSASDGQHMVHMVSAATGIFYHYLVGDPSTGNLATAKAMERPMELQFLNRQELWKNVFQDIYRYVIWKRYGNTEAKITVSSRTYSSTIHAK